MSSYFLYFRPLGVAGAYTIAILLDLHPKQHEEVYVRRVREVHCGRCGRQTPIPVQTQAEGITTPNDQIFYLIDKIIAGDEIEVTIRDERLEPYQTIIYKPNKIGIVAKQKTCVIGRMGFPNINFNPIELIDTNKTPELIPQFPKVQGLLAGPSEAP